MRTPPSRKATPRRWWQESRSWSCSTVRVLQRRGRLCPNEGASPSTLQARTRVAGGDDTTADGQRWWRRRRLRAA